jgi:hypothetical protein
MQILADSEIESHEYNLEGGSTHVEIERILSQVRSTRSPAESSKDGHDESMSGME